MSSSLQAGQVALAMMTPAQRKQVIADALANASPEERDQMLAQQQKMQREMERASPAEQKQMAQQAAIMRDIGIFFQHLRPEGAETASVLGTVDVLAAMAECQLFEALNAVIKSLEEDKQKSVVRSFITLEQALMIHGVEADAVALRETKLKPEKKRPLLLLLWVLYQHKVNPTVVLDEQTQQYFETTKRLATQMFMHAQLALPQQRWVQPTLAVSRVAALFVNELWSHDDEECIKRMKDILAPPKEPDAGMPYPMLALSARTIKTLELEKGFASKLDADACLVPAVCLPRQSISVQVELSRLHACRNTAPASIADNDLNPKGILEAYWLYVEGHTPEGSSSVLLAAQPLTVADLSTPSCSATVKFDAPKQPAEYLLTVYIASTSVVGCDMSLNLKFKVEEDDVPALD
eukprot:CAMPEP_0119317232 /NCGR_PEP_ID=MMETSP1333-20130426/42420_1 /TAXON_ID=418940 /ORGANISM="Scyphosphaera apsteinii, Strain RCC1455" /LENGTH=407 /DNA_ID=CAMNT_0007323105 /DNA_START=117 /DNA_END=1340 /DNA_ORIENTATION=+